MSKVYKTEGGVIKNLPSKEIKNFSMVNYFKNGEYINYGGMYISLTRLQYAMGEIEYFSIADRPGQKTIALIDNFVIDVSGASINESIRYCNDCLSRGRAINNFTERSDLHTFNLPTYSISGATKIMTGMTSISNGVYIVDTLSSLTFSAIFSANTIYDSFFVNSNGIKYELYTRGDNIRVVVGTPQTPYIMIPITINPIFSTNILGNTDYFNKNNFVPHQINFSSVTFTYDLSQFEGEFLIKGLYKWKDFTYFSNLIGMEYYETLYESINYYNIYNPDRDYYFIYLKKAEQPIIYGNLVTSTACVPLNVFTIIPSCDGQIGFPLLADDSLIATNSMMVAVNGLVLSTSEYYYSANTLYINGGTILSSDIITVVSSSSLNTPPLYTESYLINSIPNTTYPSGGQKVIFNTNKNKYEYWLDYECTNDPAMTVNGQLLSYGIDYYLSTSDKKRVIFESTLSVGDMITTYYNSIMKGKNSINSNIYTLSWRLPNAVKNNLGYFIVELTNYWDNNFTNPVFTGITFYVPNQLSYEINISFSGGTYGQKYITRVTNYKNYYTILNELIQSNSTSNTITLTIDTNELNNY